MTPETRLTQSILRYLARLKASGHPIFYQKMHGGPMSRAGVPDLDIVYYGRAVKLEVKANGGRPTKLQLHTMGEIERAGGVTGVVRSVEEVSQILGNVATGG